MLCPLAAAARKKRYGITLTFALFFAYIHIRVSFYKTQKILSYFKPTSKNSQKLRSDPGKMSSTTQLSNVHTSKLKVNVKVKCHDHVRHIGYLGHVPHVGHLPIIAYAQCYNLGGRAGGQKIVS